MAIDIGDPAPDFALKDQNGNTVQLSDLRGKQAAAVVFYPFTFSGTCETELCQLREDHSELLDAGVQVLAISCDSPFVQKRWAEEQGFTFPVLADYWPHGEVARAYGVFEEAIGCANRATFVIDTEGVVVDRFETDLGTAREKSRYQEALEKL